MAASSTTSNAPASTSLAYYDIGSVAPHTPYAPNPCKARYALNIKAVPFSTTWVPFPEISTVRTTIGAPPVRKFADGSDFNTLPILTDPTTGAVVGDSFDIATYLQTTYPDSGAGDLFPEQKLDYKSPFADADILVPLSSLREGHQEYAEFNKHIDATFTAHVVLAAHGFPFDPAIADECKAIFEGRAGMRWEDMTVTGEARDKMLASLRESMGALAEMLEKNPGGPFFMGDKVTYADCIVGGWLRMMSATMPKEEWEQVRQWHGGVFGRLFDGLAQYASAQ